MQSHPKAGLQRITVKRKTVNQMLESMREFGDLGSELLVLWLGELVPEKSEGHVLQAFVPPQRQVKSESGVGYFVGEKTLFELNKGLSETGLRLIAQVHSHPQEAYHSEADDRYAIVTFEGGLSLVVPDFGDAPADPTAWAVYRLHGRDWVELPKDEVKKLFVLED